MLPSPRIHLPPLEDIRDVTFVHTSYAPVSSDHGDLGIQINGGKSLYSVALALTNADADSLIDALSVGAPMIWYLLAKYCPIHTRMGQVTVRRATRVTL